MKESYDLIFTHGAKKEYRALDGSVRAMVNKGLARLRVRPAEIGKPLSGSLSDCRELKFRADGLRIIYRVRAGHVQIVDLLAIGERNRGAVFQTAARRKSLLGEDSESEP